MADIRLATDFFDHPKTMRLQAKHGAEAVLNLQRLWSWAAVNRSKGILRGMDRQSVALAAKCSIEVVGFLIEIKFIDESPTGKLKLHNWKKHQGYVFHSEERSTQAKKAAKARYAVDKKIKSTPPHKKQLVDNPPETQENGTCSEHAGSNAPSPDPVPSPDPDPDPKRLKSKPFVPPALEEVEVRIEEKNYSVDAEAFIAFYESNGWKVGRNKMKSWRAALVTWHKKEASRSGAPSGEAALAAIDPRRRRQS